jgi:hypothetical protein
MFDFGKSLINMNPDEQKKMLGNATPGQRKTALEMGIGFKNQNQQQQRQQKRDAYHDLDRLNTIVENENEAHDFFGKSLVNWQKSVTGKKPSKDATNLKKQFDEYEHGILSNYPKEGKRHGALSETLPKIKDDFLKQGHQFALNKLNERSQNVLDKGLQRLAKGALGAGDENGIQAHDDQAFDLINKYVLSEAKFDGKDADAMYDKYLSYAGVDLEKARASENENDEKSLAPQKVTQGEKGEGNLDMENLPDALDDSLSGLQKKEEAVQLKEKSSVAHARDVDRLAGMRNKYPAPKENYPFDEKTYEFLGKNKDAINGAADKFGVSPEAVAGAMGDEYNRSNFFDKYQDEYVKAFGSLEKIEDQIKAGVPKGFMGKKNVAGHDIGPGNIRVKTLHQMFVDRVEKGDLNDKLKKAMDGVIDSKASRDEQWKQYVEYATTPEGTATLASAHLEDAAAKLAPHMEGLSQEEKDAVLVTYYKQGPDYLKKYQGKVSQYTDKKAGADSKSYRPIKPGEGVGLLYQINKIRSAVGK